MNLPESEGPELAPRFVTVGLLIMFWSSLSASRPLSHPPGMIGKMLLSQFAAAFILNASPNISPVFYCDGG